MADGGALEAAEFEIPDARSDSGGNMWSRGS
jgi:hypothetical protein